MANDAFPDRLDRWIRACVDVLNRAPDFTAYRDRVASLVDLYRKDWEASGTPPETVYPMLMLMARAVWAHCPNPHLQYAAGRLPPMERNSPCHCGSGRKYKHCCQDAEQRLPLKQVNFLSFLLEVLQRKRWAELAGSKLSRPMLVHVAHEWQGAGRYQELLALLEPWFKDERHFTEPHEPLLDCLLDCYDALHKPRKKQQLLERGLQHGDRGTVAALLQRQAAIAHDRGETAEAWALFKAAQQVLPDSPSLCHLELLLLIAQGDEAQARERARFWVQSLQRRRDPELQGLIELAQSVAREGAAAFGELAAQHEPALAELEAQLRAAPPPQAHYHFPHRSSESAGPLEPSPALAKALRTIEARMSRAQQGGGDPELGPVLAQAPLLWHSFELIAALEGIAHSRPLPGVGERFALPLLKRAEALLRENLRAHKAEGLALEWGWLQNRTALSLLADLALLRIELGCETDAALSTLRWLVDELNPQDNQGLRMPLMALLLQRGDYAEAAALAERYPDDLPEMQYQSALALHLLGNEASARAMLARVAADYPKIARMLLAPKPPKRPRGDAYGVVLGGDEEAWLFRDEHLPLWTRTGGLDWLRANARVGAR